MSDLRLGRYQDVLADVECDALIVDAPYSERTHSGHDSSANGHEGLGKDTSQRRSISYTPWTAEDVRAFVDFWHPRTRGWFVTLTDHVLARAWETELERVGRYVFSPLACVESGSRVRLSGDGPSQWSTWCVVARPRVLHRWGTLPGAYVVPPGEREAGAARKAVTGGKPLWLMRELVRDYSREGELVCDPCAGAGTTLLAAALEDRRAVGAEAMPDHYELARERLARASTPVTTTTVRARALAARERIRLQRAR